MLFFLFFLINRRWLQWSTMQQQLLTLLWREEGRPLRTTAMVISSFICCWLPYFVWLLPFQQQQRAYSVQTSIGFFFARLAAFSNVRRHYKFYLDFMLKNTIFLINKCAGTDQPGHLRLSQPGSAAGSMSRPFNALLSAEQTSSQC